LNNSDRNLFWKIL